MMSYVLYLDKNENFECTVDVTNASLKGSMVRLVAESENLNVMFTGKIENGKASIPIKRLKGILGENTSGKLRLEVIVDDMFFSPWESDFIVEQHTSVKVQVTEQKVSSKPSVNVKVSQPKSIKDSIAAEIAAVLSEQNITQQNIGKHRNRVSNTINSYFEKHSEYNQYKPNIISEVVRKL
jgi:hypothetical protein